MDKKQELAAALEALEKEYLAKEAALLADVPADLRKEVGRPIKSIAMLDKFTANGHEYVIRTSLPLERFEIFEDTQVEVGYGVDFRSLFGQIRNSYDFLNEGRQADGAVVLYNIMNGIKNQIDKRTNPVLKLCTLFICRIDEDLTKYDEVMAKAKIEDWKKEGIATEDFFSIAFNSVNGFMPVYNQISQDISSHMKNVQAEISPKVKTKQ